MIEADRVSLGGKTNINVECIKNSIFRFESLYYT